jgi:hypothetical protein
MMALQQFHDETMKHREGSEVWIAWVVVANGVFLMCFGRWLCEIFKRLIVLFQMDIIDFQDAYDQKYDC